MRLPPQIDNGQLADNGESLDRCHMQGFRLHLPETNQGKEHREELLLNARQQKAICSEQKKCIPGHGTCCFFFVGTAGLSDWTLTSKPRQVTRGLRSSNSSTESLATGHGLRCHSAYLECLLGADFRAETAVLSLPRSATPFLPCGT